MKAIIYNEYGSADVLKITEVENPKPKENEILLRVKASSVSIGVAIVRKGEHPDSKFFSFMIRLMFGWKKPKNPILGYEFSGIVEEVGSKVTKFKKSDKVFGTTTGLKQGAYAEFLTVPEKWNSGVISIMPETLSFEEAAVLPIGSMTAFQLLNKAKIKKEDKILIYGASGSVGTYAVQLAKIFQANITGVCREENFNLAKKIGCDFVIDYTKDEFKNLDKKFSIVFDAVGKLENSTAKKLLDKNGKFITVKSLTSENLEELEQIKNFVKEGKLKPVLDKIYKFEEIKEAHNYVDLGHKKGNVAVQISNE